MTIRDQLETRIAFELSRLTPVDMQRVAEDYARIRFPDRFPRFDFRAFSVEGKSRKGWPDAWIDKDGRIDGVEATVAKKKSAVLRHLKKDLKNALTRSPKLSGLVLVSGHPDVQLSHDELVNWHKRFIDEAGISQDRIHLVFGGGLVEELARPEFARTRSEVLDLPVDPTHFKLVNPKRGPDEIRLREFIPSDEDYASGRVHWPAAAKQVIDRLEHTGCALVRGVGACGKSVLAWLIALEAAKQRLPAYLIDLADYVDANPDTDNALVADLQRFGGPQVLFIVDNCHLNERLTKEVVMAWEAMVKSQKPRLLLLGRELQSGKGSLIDGLEIEPLLLKAQQPEVRGVYLRLALRQTGDQAPPEPPPEVLDEWVSVFGGDPRAPDTTTDLIAFSAAVRGRMAYLLKEQWTLSETDAIHEVRSVYLDLLTDGEMRNLMRLCVMEELELSLPEEALADRRVGFKSCSRRHGLVFLQTAGASGQYVRYRLAHAALGRLILQASHESVEPEAERLAIALQCPSAGVATFFRLATTGCTHEARQLINAMLLRPTFLLNIGSLERIHQTLRWMQQLGVSLPANLVQTLTAQTGRGELTKRALETPLHDLANFLGYADNNLKPVFTALAKDLALPESCKELTKRALKTPFHYLANFLGYAENNLKPVFTSLATDLALPENCKVLTKQALETPLHFLASFLGYAAKTPELKSVFTALVEDLALPENCKVLTKQALETPLGDLASFLGYAAKTPELKSVFTALVEDLAQPGNLCFLTKEMERQPLHAVVSVLRSDVASDLWATVFADINAANWLVTRHMEEMPNLNAFVAFQSIATQKGRPELAEAPALRLIDSSTPVDWHQPGIGLHHLSHVLRFARGAAPGDIEKFLDFVATPQWVDDLLRSVPTGGLAGNLFGLASALEPDKRKWFLREALRERISCELLRLRVMCETETRVQILALLGAAAAIGISIPAMHVNWPGTSELANMLEQRVPDADRTTIGPMQVQLWLGLREMARLRSDSVTVAPPLANRILDLWVATQDVETGATLPPHVYDLNAAMIAWLRQCKAAGWCLVQPHEASMNGHQP